MDGSGSNSRGESTISSVSVSTPISHDVLDRMYPVKVSTFVKECEKYDLGASLENDKILTLTVPLNTAFIDQKY